MLIKSMKRINSAGAESAPTFTIWGRKAPPYIINDGFKGKIPYKFFENCRLVKQHLDGDISNAYLAVNLRSIKATKTAD